MKIQLESTAWRQAQYGRCMRVFRPDILLHVNPAAAFDFWRFYISQSLEMC